MTRGAWADRALLGGAALALAGTFLRPGLPVERALFEHVVVLDITQSMGVPDQRIGGQPASRLAYARHALHRALGQLPCGSKVGWAIFAEYRSYLLMAPIEVCAHLDELRATLGRIGPDMAWSGNSEVAKGLYSGLAIARQLPERPSLAFVTDGHEAPPVNPRHRPPFTGQPGEVRGVVVGVGELQASAIPKIDPQGRPLGFWGADEVLQTDPRSLGRSGSVSGERLAEDPDAAPAAPLPGATPGTEHRSALREPYLRLLAGETGLAYHRLGEPDALAQALTAPALARPAPGRVDLRGALAALALALLLARHAVPLARRVRWRQVSAPARPSEPLGRARAG